tara:strand:- start:410 stop:826 length:417 start_codon:yes stop_codon:yes gene_type:complete
MFRNDLKFGKSYELKAIGHIERSKFNLGNFLHQSVGLCCEYDLKFEKGLIEVKADRMVHKTNNWFIEFNYKDKPSGYLTSKSDYYCLVDTYNCDYYLVKIDDLIDICSTINVSVYGGDNKQSLGKLVPKWKINKYLLN